MARIQITLSPDEIRRLHATKTMMGDRRPFSRFLTSLITERADQIDVELIDPGDEWIESDVSAA
jgi:hypothetical protein